MNRIILLDRDGVINRDSFQYIKNVDEFIFIPGSIEAIGRLTQAGYRVGVATNQSGVSRGLYTEQILSDIHQKMIDEITKLGGVIEAIEYCIHLPQENCDCRKPQPQMLYNLAKKMTISLKGVPFVGDRVSDVEVALKVGATPIVVLSPMANRDAFSIYPNIPIYSSLGEYVDELLAS